VTATHTGSAHLLPSVHERIRAWSAEGERPLSGVNWEVSVEGSEDASCNQTQVFYLLQEPKAKLPARKKWPRFNERAARSF